MTAENNTQELANMEGCDDIHEPSANPSSHKSSLPSSADHFEWSPDKIAAQQDEVLDRLDQLNNDILSLLDEFNSQLKADRSEGEAKEAA